MNVNTNEDQIGSTDKGTMKRSFVKKKETGAAGRKRRKLEAKEAKKSSQFFKTFLEKPKPIKSPDSSASLLESDKSLSNRPEHAAGDVAGDFDENVDKDVGDAVGYEGGDVAGVFDEDVDRDVGDAVGCDGGDIELINDTVSSKTALDEVPNVINQHDIGLLKFNNDTRKAIVSESLRIEIIKLSARYFQNSEGPFLPRNNRSMNKSWFKRTLANGEEVTRSWLVYSPSKKSAFCICCLLFSRSNHQSQSSLEQESGFNQWKAPERMTTHELSKNHRECFTQWIVMERNFAENRGIIDVEMQLAIEKEKQKWRDILKRIIHCVKFLATQNLALRGHRESLQLDDASNVGNFLGLLKLLAIFDPIMQAHLTNVQNSPGFTSYLSPSIQNEIIHLMASTVRQNLLKNIRKAKYFGLMFDSTPDQAHREQVSEVVRYVEVNFEKKTVRVAESFLGFIQINLKDAESLVETILNQLEKDEMELQDCRSQCYDNAPVMAGYKSGVQQRIYEKNHLAVFVNCDNHSLNLVGVNAAKQDAMMVTFFGTIQAIYIFFSSSTQRWEKLKTVTPIVVKSESTTRWSARVEAVKPVNKYLKKILEILQTMMDDANETSDTRSDARQLYNRMLSYDFLILLGFWNKVLISIDRVQKRLQDSSMNFHDAALDLKALRDHFNDEREALVTESLEVGLRLCQEWEVETERRPRQKKRMAGETSRDAGLTDKQEIERVMKGTIDRLYMEMDERFTRLHDTDEKFGFLLDVEGLCYSVDSDILKTKCQNFSNFYNCDVDGQQLYEEILDFRMLLASRTNSKISRPEEILQFIVQYEDESIFPNLRIAIQIMLTIAVSIASCERSFSKLKLILNYLRASMGQDRLCDLALLSVEREETENTNFELLIDEFASMKTRKVQF